MTNEEMQSAMEFIVSARMRVGTLFFIAPAPRARWRAASVESRCAASAGLRPDGSG